MSIRIKLLLFVLLLALPLAGRWAWFNRGSYQSPDIPEIDESQIAPLLSEYQPFEEEPITSKGHVIFDLSHANNVEVNDLTPLRNRLEARAVTIKTFDSADDTLAAHLHQATALVIVAPTEGYTAEEREAIVDFVEDGGRLLLAADPTRPVPAGEEDEFFLDLFSLFFPTSAIPAINSLASAFGIVYYDDYLYNLADNEGNYRNVKFTSFNDQYPLTENLETLVLFAAHSLRSDGPSLVVGDQDTRSSVRSGETDLTAITLSANERVLALGDVTFLTAPYHTIGDNDRFLSHIADWLVVDERQRDDLEDFPYLFKQPVDLVQVSGEFLDPRLIARSSALQETFEQVDLPLDLRAEADPDHDALLIGTFDDLESIEGYLITAEITITMVITEEEEAITPDGSEEETEESEDNQEEAPSQPAPSPTPAPTEEIEKDTESEATGEIDQVSAEEEEDTEDLEEEKEDKEEKQGPRGLIEIKGLGTVPIEGTHLFITDHSANRLAVIVLAEDGETAIEALERLASRDLSDCIEASGMVMICSTGETLDGIGLDTEEETAEDGAGEGDRLLIISDDDRPEGQRTGAAEFEAILSDSYDVTVWSTKHDGLPTEGDLTGYDAYIIDSGDYAFDTEDFEFFSVLASIEEGGIMLIGAQPLPVFEEDYEPIEDLSVADTSHPLAKGFTQDEVISLLPSESSVPAIVITEEELFGPGDDEVAVVFTRGPDSPQAGTPALLVGSSNTGEGPERFILGGFAFYRLPEETQRTLALNAAAWLVGQSN
jgi:hypothetical protein